MRKRPKSAITGLRQHLLEIYDADAATAVEAGLRDRLEHYRNRLGRSPAGSGLGESDVLLITYGDTLVDDTHPPLQVLRRFHKKRLQGVFDLVHILPFHPYSSDDGFSVIDFYAVRDDLGDWSDINALAADCRVMADAVVNHVSSESVWFRAYLADDPAYKDFFIDCDPAADLDTVVRPRTSPLLTSYEAADGTRRQIWTTFSADQADLNYANPQVLLAVIEVLYFLVSQGASLLRLDAVTYLWKQPGTSSANMPETHTLIKIMRAAVSALCEDVIVITETNVPHHENIAYFGDGRDEAHMVYNFALPPLLAYSFIAGDGQRLSDWVRTLDLPGDDVCFLNFSASHDGVGVRPVEDILQPGELRILVDAATAAGGRVSGRTIAGEEQPYELNCTFLDLIARPPEPGAVTSARFVASQAIVLALPGVPAVYIQSLLATRNDLQLAEKTGRARSINRSQLHIDDVGAALGDKSTLTFSVFTELSRLIRVRREQPAFNPYARFRVLDLGRRVFAVERWPASGEQRIVCVVNLTRESTMIELEASAAGKDLLCGRSIAAGDVELAPYEVLWVEAGK